MNMIADYNIQFFKLTKEKNWQREEKIFDTIISLELI